jgi:hypothetical protein
MSLNYIGKKERGMIEPWMIYLIGEVAPRLSMRRGEVSSYKKVENLRMFLAIQYTIVLYILSLLILF